MSAMPLKIMHVIDSLEVGGMERVLIEVVRGLDPEQFTQVVVCLSRRGSLADLLPDGTRCHDLGKGDGRGYSLPFKLARLIRAERPDIVHTQSWSGIDGMMARWLSPGPRLIHSEHGRYFSALPGESWKSRLGRRRLYHAADAVFAVSRELGDYYCDQTGFPRERMTVIANGIDLQRLDRADPSGVRESLGISPHDFVIGTVARLDPIKDPLTLVEAFAHLLARAGAPSPKLLIVGEGSRRSIIERFLDDRGLRGQAILAGLRLDVPRLLKSMDLFVLSSLSEGMPLTVLEAMAASLPVVATRVGSLPELVEEGRTGFLVAPRDPLALAERILRLQANPGLARELGHEARLKVARQFSLERMLQAYRDLYLR